MHIVMSSTAKIRTCVKLTIEESRPSTSTVELRLAHVERRITARAGVNTVVEVLVEFALPWRLCSFLADDSELSSAY